MFGNFGLLAQALFGCALVALGIYVFWRVARVATGLARRVDPGLPLFDSEEQPTETLFARVEGVDETNPDGTPRQELLRHCNLGDPLVLALAAAHADAGAQVHVLHARGGQLGRLDARSAAAVAASLERGLRVEATVAGLTARMGLPHSRELRAKITRALPGAAAHSWRGAPDVG